MRLALGMGLILSTLWATDVTAQSVDLPAATLKFVGSNIELVSLTNESGQVENPSVGLRLGKGWVLRTAKGGTAELVLEFDGTRIKVGENSTLRISDLRSTTNNNSANYLAVAAGVVRIVTERVDSKQGPPSINVKTPTANCATSGADFVVNLDVTKGVEAVLVLDGTVAFAKDFTRPSLTLSSGMYADALGLDFLATSADMQIRTWLISRTQFGASD